MSTAKLPNVNGTVIRQRDRQVWLDHQGRLIDLKRVDRLSRKDLVEIVERIRATLWMSDVMLPDETMVHLPDIDDGGAGGADAVDLVVEILGDHGLNPIEHETAAATI